ncbi:hypothetical protein MIMGU_mgv1a0188461mg, partial [Erythranthe guttata]
PRRNRDITIELERRYHERENNTQ